MQCSFYSEEECPDGSIVSSTCQNRAEILIWKDPCYGLCRRCAYEKLKAENKELKTMLIEERLPNFCTGKECGCAERVSEARKKARVKLRQELEQAPKGGE